MPDDGTGQSSDDPQTPPNGDPGPQDPPQNGPQGDDKGDQDGKPAGRPKDADADWKARARQHEDRAKTHKAAADAALAERDGLKKVLDGLRAALDPEGTGKGATPEELAKQATEQAAQARAEVKLAKVEQVEQAVKDAIEARPGLKANQPKPKSGTADMTGGGANGSGQLSRADLKTMSATQIEKARKEGRLKTLLGG